MITRLGLAPAASGLTTGEAIDHWRTTHADVASQIPGLRRYVQLHPALDDGQHLLGHPGFEVCAITGFQDLAAMHEGFSSPAYLEAVRADEAVLIDRDAFTVLVGESSADGATVDEAPAVLAAFLRRRPAAEPTAVGELAADLLQEQDLAGWEVVTGLRATDRPEQLDGDALLLACFADADAAVDWAHAEEGWASLRRAMARVVFGVERFVANPNRVV